MNKIVIDIYNINKWPDNVLKFLNSADELFYKRSSSTSKRYEDQIVLAQAFDDIIYEFKNVLAPYYLIGYHCTRLTENEIATIISEGMSLPNTTMLKNRIDTLMLEGVLQKEIAEQLLLYNEADEKYRKNMLWFCLFPPHIAGQLGIERLFKSWGGEALYNSHESNPVTGSVLNKIGVPCVIEAYLPISALGNYFELTLANHYMASKDMCELNAKYHDGFIRVNLPSDHILNIIKYPSDRFIDLTQCNTWDFVL